MHVFPDPGGRRDAGRTGIDWITQGLSGCVRALREKISVIAPLKSHQFRSLVGSGRAVR